MTKSANKIYTDNFEAIEAKIQEAQGRATARTLTAEGVAERLEAVAYNDLRGITKKALAGTRATVHGSTDKLPSAYKYPAESTQVVVEHDGKGWVLVEARRDRLAQKGSGLRGVELALSDSAKEWVINSLRFV